MPDNHTSVIYSQNKQITARIKTHLSDTDFQITGESGSFNLVNTLLDQHAPDILIANLNMDSNTINEHISRLKTISPRTKILLIQNSFSSEEVTNAIRAGASIFLPESLDLDGLPGILDMLIKEEFYFPAFMAESLLEAAQQENSRNSEFPFRLTEKEKTILDGFARHYSLSQISHGLNMPDNMIKAYASNILKKLHFIDIARKHYREILSDIKSPGDLT